VGSVSESSAGSAVGSSSGVSLGSAAGGATAISSTVDSGAGCVAGTAPTVSGVTTACGICMSQETSSKPSKAIIIIILFIIRDIRFVFVSETIVHQMRQIILFDCILAQHNKAANHPAQSIFPIH
jgi:hypothetical protein